MFGSGPGVGENEKGAGQKEARLGGNQVRWAVGQTTVSKEQDQPCCEGPTVSDGLIASVSPATRWFSGPRTQHIFAEQHSKAGEHPSSAV